MPRYFSDQGGIFEVARRADGKSNCVRQFVSVRGIDWLDEARHPPTTIQQAEEQIRYSPAGRCSLA
jgi:hypothetical protein